MADHNGHKEGNTHQLEESGQATEQVAPAKFKPNRFDAPLPGESLTMPEGSAPYEKPPKFTDTEEALESLFDKLTGKREAFKLTQLLESGAPTEAIARTVIKAGFDRGQWSVDTGLSMAPVVMYMIAAIGQKAGVKDMKFTNPDNDMVEFLGGLNTSIRKDEFVQEDAKEVTDILNLSYILTGGEGKDTLVGGPGQDRISEAVAQMREGSGGMVQSRNMKIAKKLGLRPDEATEAVARKVQESMRKQKGQ